MPNRPDASPDFPSTCWGMIASAGLRATVQDREALAQLCQAYWYPIYAFIRRKGNDPDAAQDLTQSYFARLLEKGLLLAADREKGRFRTFLLTDCTHFLADRRDHDRAKKRGGGLAPLSIDARDAEGRFLAEPADESDSPHGFDRTWAVTLLERAMDHLQFEQEAIGRGVLFARLKPALRGEPEALPYAEIAAELKTTAVAVQSAAQRLRGRFRDLIRSEIAATLDEPNEDNIEEEIRALFAVLAK
jgi:DNA-directed RNA polymerase specialized sigma24 family protein